MPWLNNKGADQSAHLHSLGSTFVIHYQDGIIATVTVSKIPRLLLASLAEQAGLSLTWSQP